jgi:hypothetical protein
MVDDGIQAEEGGACCHLSDDTDPLVFGQGEPAVFGQGEPLVFTQSDPLVFA